MERHVAMKGVHSGKAMGADDELENASVYLLETVVTKELLFEKSCFADRYPFPIPYNGKPEDILSDEDLKEITDDWNDLLFKVAHRHNQLPSPHILPRIAGSC